MISKTTLVAAYQAFQAHIPDTCRRGDLLDDLVQVTGNRSFMDSMSALYELHRLVEKDMRRRGDGLETQILALLQPNSGSVIT